MYVLRRSLKDLFFLLRLKTVQVKLSIYIMLDRRIYFELYLRKGIIIVITVISN